MLQKIVLHNIRNHQLFSLDIPKKGCVIIGPNGSGKTTILESAFALATTKSFRARSMFSIISHEEIVGKIEAHTDQETLSFAWQKSPRKKTLLYMNEVPMTAPEILKRKSFLATLFCPEDLQLPFATPEKRRRYMNRVLVPLFPEHFLSLRRFDKILKSRNALLKRIAEQLAQKEELEFFNAEFAKESEKITAERKRFFEENSELVTKKYKEISGKNEDVVLKFTPHVTENVLGALEENYDRDIARGVTSKGAHHDDFCFFLREEPLEETGSRGEVRSALLALKMAEYAFTKKESGHTPLLLLDDVFSELDAERRKHLAELAFKSQTILTGTDMPKRALEEIDIEVVEL